MWIAAAVEGDAQAVAAWLDEGGEVDAGWAERNDTTLLMAAAWGGQEAVVRMLLQRGASVNLQDSLDGTALMGAAVNGHTTMVQVLLDAKADASLQDEDGYTALMLAEQEKHTATVQLLREHAERLTAEAKAKTAAAEAELLAEEAAEKEAVTIKKGKGKKKKAKAAPSTAADDLAEADALASTTRPAGLRIRDRAALLRARQGMRSAVAALAARRAAAWTQAAQSDERAAVNAADGAPPLGGQEAMVRMLLQRGASVNLQDSLDTTALMGAARNGHTTTVQVLLDAKADASLQATDGYTALMVAEHHKQTATAQLLRRHRRAAGR